MDQIQLIFEIIGLIFTIIISIAGIKYLFDGIKKYRIRKHLQKPKEKRNTEKLKKILEKESWKRSAENLIGNDKNSLVEKLNEFERNLLWKLDDINDTLKRFKNYQVPDYIRNLQNNTTVASTTLGPSNSKQKNK
ncbi:MAG: hypothetical protein ACFE8A_02395 [Candidatus Hodarchaeota archaeon]